MADNVVLRGMSLKNTEYVTGVVVYTGHQTKIMMNTSKAFYKMSKMMTLTNTLICCIFVLQLILSCTGGTLGTWWIQDNIEVSYLGYELVTTRGYAVADKDPTFIWLRTTGTWILMLTNFVPISLLVTLEVVKLFQGVFM